jgi:predicted AAA+ superfamily ATPase
MLQRNAATCLQQLARWYPVLLICGPRQSGKTTLARAAFANKPYATLEDPDVRASAQSDPRGFLALYPQGAVLDEVQHVPALLSYLQTAVDTQRIPGQWVLTGSQQLGLLGQVSQSLAGRAGLLQLLPFSLGELQAARAGPPEAGLHDMLWRGLYPATAVQYVPPPVWFGDYFATYIERDVRQMLNVRDLTSFRLFVRMCAARVGQVLNLSGLAADCGISSHTAKGWLSVLEASYITYTLAPHYVNFGKQISKSPKLYFHDTGLAAWLVGLRSGQDVGLSSMLGPLFENWAVSEALKHSFNHRLDMQLHYWRNKSGVEVDLLITHAGSPAAQMHGIELKAGQTVAGDWFKSLRKYQELLQAGASTPDPTTPQPSAFSAALVYGGQQAQLRAGVPVMGWQDWPQWLARQCPAHTAPAASARGPA